MLLMSVRLSFWPGQNLLPKIYKPFCFTSLSPCVITENTRDQVLLKVQRASITEFQNYCISLNIINPYLFIFLFALFFVSIIIFVLKKQDHICINAILPSFFLFNLLTLGLCRLFSTWCKPLSLLRIW